MVESLAESSHEFAFTVVVVHVVAFVIGIGTVAVSAVYSRGIVVFVG